MTRSIEYRQSGNTDKTDCESGANLMMQWNNHESETALIDRPGSQ